MRSIGQAGWAVHGYFGVGAKTLGNPGGATSGDGSMGGGGGPPPLPGPPFTPTLPAATLPAGTSVQQLQIIDANTWAAVASGSAAAWTSNGGASWTPVAGPLGNITQPQTLLLNPTGPHLLLFGLDAGNARSLSVSNDAGHSYTNVAPVGPTHMPAEFFYSAPAGRFFFFDQTAALVWTSVDGTTWASHAIPTAVEGFFSADSGAETIVQAVNNVSGEILLWRSTDAQTWVQEFFMATATDHQSGPVAWTGAHFVTTFLVDDITYAYTSNANGTVWTQQSTSADPAVPPYNVLLAFFGGNYWDGLNGNDFTNLASSPDAVTWTPVTTVSSAMQGGQGLLAAGTRLYEYGLGLTSSTDGVTFLGSLAFTAAGFVNGMVAGSGLILAYGVDDAGNGQIWKES